MLDWRLIWVAVQAVRRRARAIGRSLEVGMVGFLGVGLPETGCASFQVAFETELSAVLILHINILTMILQIFFCFFR